MTNVSFFLCRVVFTLHRDQRLPKRAYYYAHLDRYAAGLKEGMTLKRDDLEGYVGASAING